MTSNLEKLKHLFADCLDIPIADVTQSLTQDQVPSWDSLANAMLILELEEVFGVSFETDEVLELTSLDRTVEVLRKKGVSF